ncbi:MAG TPA: IS30 family transposase [Gammaproteobacteria bacterium]|nr:IS30 family transposase [Gammaproteobacteria bacterium]
MGVKYKHLTEQDRIFLRIMLEKRYPKSKIAHILKVNPSTIYREVKRNSCTHWYSGQKYYWNHSVQEKYLKRRKRWLKLEKDVILRNYVHSKLKSGWSPYQIEGRLKIENDGHCIISHESIYHYVYSDMDRRYVLHKYLRRKHSYRIKQGQRKARIPTELLIGSRPETINNREEFGHWECDLMVFKKGVKTNLIPLRERKTRYLVAIKNQSREAAGTALALISTVKNIKHLVKSITFDQGSEFKKYEWIKKCLETNIYFCEPASPHQKGAIENGNATIRIVFQRDYEVEKLKQRYINSVIKNINNRPMKCLYYKTPAELFNEFKKQHYEN